MKAFLRRVEPTPVRAARHRYLARRAASVPELTYERSWERRREPKPTLDDPRSQACTQAQMESPAYQRLREALRMPPDMHRKYWEFAYMVQALDSRGALSAGRRGLGFAVGTEPLAAYFASRGCEVLATDLAPDNEASEGWKSTGQHMTSVGQLNELGICPPEAFAQRVETRWVDMTAIDDDLRDFDFTWSSCAFEHLGSLPAGLSFVRKQMDCLRPGGVSVHTTELNISSDDGTVDAGPTVLYRRRDLQALADALRAQGHTVLPLTFRLGDQPGDRFIVPPPYTTSSPHLKIQYGSYVTTSFGLIIEKAK